jgi:hypothetical protein
MITLKIVLRIVMKLRKHACEKAGRYLWKHEHGKSENRGHNQHSDADRSRPVTGSISAVELE